MNNTQKEWYIGIDFGTSNTCVIAYEKKEDMLYSRTLVESETEKIGNIESLNIPSCISRDFNPANSEEPLYYVGEMTSKHPLLRPFKGLKDAAREVTPNNGLFGKIAIEYPFEECGLNSKLEMGNNDVPLPVQVRELVIQFFKKILHIGDEKFGIDQNSVKKIVIGQPVVNGRKSTDGTKFSYEETLKGLLAECFTNKYDERFIGTKDKDGKPQDGIITVISEPELAGVTYLYSEEQRANKKVLVIDIGGGTTDFSVLEYTKEVAENNIGSCEVAGNMIDKVIFDLLPPEVPHSKAKCREWKEHLFAEEISSPGNITIKPFDTDRLSSWNIGVKAGGMPYYIYYNKPDDTTDYNGIVIGEKIREKVFKEIGDALQNALDGKNGTNATPITGITTVFFCGGTSIITPLREHLVNIVTEKESPNGEPKYCVDCFDKKNDVVTMFSNDKAGAKTIKVSRESSIPITCYNAVAIGACIKAMGKNVQPRPAICFIQPDGEKISFEASESNLLIKTEDGVPFARYIVDRNFINYWCNDPTSTSPTIDLSVEIEEKKVITLKLNKDDCISAGCFSIIAILKTRGLDFVAYVSDENKDTPYATVMGNLPISIVSKKSF